MTDVVVVKTPPAALPVTLAQAKAQCRAVEFDDDDALIAGLVATATSWLDGPDGWLGRALVQQALELRLHGFPPYWGDLQHVIMDPWSAYKICLPFGRLISIDSIDYIDTTGTPQTIDPTDATAVLVTGVGSDKGGLEPSWESWWPYTRIQPESVKIGFTCGYGQVIAASAPGAEPVVAASNPVPAAIQQAILLLVSHWYVHPDAVVGVDNRDSSVELPLGANALLAPFRLYR